MTRVLSEVETVEKMCLLAERENRISSVDLKELLAYSCQQSCYRCHAGQREFKSVPMHHITYYQRMKVGV